MKENTGENPRSSGIKRGMVNACLAFLRSPYTGAALSFLCLTAIVICLFSIQRSYTYLDERITIEAERNDKNFELLKEKLSGLENALDEHEISLAMAEERLLEKIAALEQNLRSALSSSAGGTQQAIRRLDASYQSLLEARKGRTLESLYKEDVLEAERKEAAEAFTAGRYVTASRLYAEIADAHPEDMEARFYQYYSLFLSNRQNQNNYRIIKEAMILLEQHGYTRKELSETLDYIDKETKTRREMP